MTIREKLINWLDWCDRARPYSRISDDSPSIQKIRRALAKAWDELDRAIALGDAAVECCQSSDALDQALDNDELLLGERAWYDAVGRAQVANDLAWHEWNKARDAAAVFESNQ